MDQARNHMPSYDAIPAIYKVVMSSKSEKQKLTMASWTAGTCRVNGIDVHFLRTGGDKPPVLLLHGLMTKGACWTPVAEALAREYDVIMPDARGHGNSSAPLCGYRYDNLAADVMMLIDELGLIEPVLIGHSMGGMTAAVVASKRPKRIRALILADPTFLTPERQREVYESDVAEEHRRILNRPQKEYVAEMLARRRHRSPDSIELFVQARFQTSIHAFEVLTPPNPDYVHLINSIDVPSLLAIGDTNPVVSPELAAELARLNSHVNIEQIAKAGHGLPFDQPKIFAAACLTFLRSLNCKSQQY